MGKGRKPTGEDPKAARKRYRKKYYESHKDSIEAYNKAWKLAHPEKAKEMADRSRAKNIATAAAWRKSEAGRAYAREYTREYRRLHPKPKTVRQPRPPIVKEPKQESAAQREHRHEIERKSHEKHRDERIETARLRREANREIIRQKDAAYRAKNIEAVRERSRKWAKQNRANHPVEDKIQKHARRAKERGGGGHFTKQQIADLYQRQKQKCANCKKHISDAVGREKYHIDHVMPIARGGSSLIENIQLLCPHCNHTKHAQHPDEWAKRNGKLFC